MDPGGVDEPPDLLVVVGVLGAKEVGKLKKQLPTEDLIAVHVRDIFELRLDCGYENSLMILRVF